MNYKQINENWQTYQLVEYLLEDRSYVTGVLGIELPLNESGQVSLTQELKEQIITEHLLLESDGPVKYSGSVGVPAMVKNVLFTVSKLRDIKSDELERQIESNTRRIFPKIF